MSINKLIVRQLRVVPERRLWELSSTELRVQQENYIVDHRQGRGRSSLQWALDLSSRLECSSTVDCSLTLAKLKLI
jgi:hypothetical protein